MVASAPMIPAETFSADETVERIAPPSAETFQRRYVRPGRPVIIVGAIEDWPARRLWSAEYLVRRFGKRVVPVANVGSGRVSEDPRLGFVHRNETLGDYIERLLAPGPADGYPMFPVQSVLPELQDDLRVPAFVPSPRWSMFRFWMSAPDTRMPLHMDLPDNLFAQLVGRKRVTLFSPREERRMYRNPPWSPLPHMSRVDAEEPDLARYPRFGEAHPLRCVVEPGDLLYIPRLWWHQIRSIDFCLSVNYWWAWGWVWPFVRGALAYQRFRKLRY
jgi:Cupin-like domain